MGIYVFSRDVLYDILARDRAVDFGREIIPHALGTHRVHAYLYRGFWADVGTVSSFYDVNLMLTRRGAPFSFFHPTRPIYTRPRFLPAARLHDCRDRRGAHRRRRVSRHVRGRAERRRHPHVDSSRRDESRARSCSARTTTRRRVGDVPLGIGRDAVLDRVIVDKNARIGDGARLVNERGIQDVDGDGYYIRSGIIVVPKGGVVKPGTVV